MVQLFKLHPVVDPWLEQWIALRVLHVEVSSGEVCAEACLHELSFFVRHRLQVHVSLLLHHHGAHLVLVDQAPAVQAVIFV